MSNIYFVNFSINILGEDFETLKLAFAILQDQAAKGYRIWPVKSKFWGYDKENKENILSFDKCPKSYINTDVIEFPVELNTFEMAQMAHKWLKNTPICSEVPDFDGDAHPGWRLFTGAPQSLISIEPAWCLYGK